MLTLIIAEAALETVPKNLWSHPAIRYHSKRQKKHPQQLLLDRSLHHAAMRKLEKNEKRGRPDITHFALLEALGSPLNKEGLLQVYIHTNKDYTITVNPRARLPRNYNRFLGLIEQLYQLGKVPSEGEVLLKLESKTMPNLLAEIGADYLMLFSRQGKPRTVEDAVSSLKKKLRPTIIIGGFPRGHFSKTIVELADEIISVDSEMLEAWTLTARIIYEYERTLLLPKQRIDEN